MIEGEASAECNLRRWAVTGPLSDPLAAWQCIGILTVFCRGYIHSVHFPFTIPDPSRLIRADRCGAWLRTTARTAHTPHYTYVLHESALRGCGSMAGRLARDVSVKSKLLALIAFCQAITSGPGETWRKLPIQTVQIV